MAQKTAQLKTKPPGAVLSSAVCRTGARPLGAFEALLVLVESTVRGETTCYTQETTWARQLVQSSEPLRYMSSGLA